MENSEISWTRSNSWQDSDWKFLGNLFLCCERDLWPACWIPLLVGFATNLRSLFCWWLLLTGSYLKFSRYEVLGGFTYLVSGWRWNFSLLTQWQCKWNKFHFVTDVWNRLNVRDIVICKLRICQLTRKGVRDVMSHTEDWLSCAYSQFNTAVVRFFLFSTASRPATIGPTRPPIQSLLEVISPGLKRQRHEAGHSASCSAEIKNCGALPPLLLMSSWRSA
jgi:hypothetical protein